MEHPLRLLQRHDRNRIERISSGIRHFLRIADGHAGARRFLFAFSARLPPSGCECRLFSAKLLPTELLARICASFPERHVMDAPL
jgi:hypothetical protein